MNFMPRCLSPAPACVQPVDAPRRYRPVDIAELCAATGWVRPGNGFYRKHGKLLQGNKSKGEWSVAERTIFIEYLCNERS